MQYFIVLALIIMLIHYLQRTEIPVLPYLQDSKAFKMTTDEIVGKHRVQFAQPDDEYRTGFRKNDLTIGELFTRFFDYFINFDWQTEVIQIRSPSKLYKLDKDWQQKSMAIEDPFDLEHNLSSGVRLSSNFCSLKFKLIYLFRLFGHP